MRCCNVETCYQIGANSSLQASRIKPSGLLGMLLVKRSSHFQESRKTRRLWQGIQSTTDYQPTPPPCDGNTDFLNHLNNFSDSLKHSETNQRGKPPLTIRTRCLVLTQLTSAGLLGESTRGKLQVLTIYLAVSSKVGLTNWLMA